MSDIVLLERKQLTSGTTWHAAGLVGQLRQSMNMTKLVRAIPRSCIAAWKPRPGQATASGNADRYLWATTSRGGMEELKRNASMAKVVLGLEVNVVGPDGNSFSVPPRLPRG